MVKYGKKKLYRTLQYVTQFTYKIVFRTALVEGLYVICRPGVNIYAEIKNVK